MRKALQHGLLYAAYMLTCLEDRGWSFAISLCMQLLGGMQLVSIEQLAEGIAQMVFSGYVGRAVDARSERKWGMVLCLVGNNFSILASCALFALCLTVERSLWIYTVFLTLGMLFCSSYRVFVAAEKSLAGRDWALVLVSDEDGALSSVNALLTSLDQFANVLSPLLLGALLTFAGLRTACIVLAVCSMVSFVLKGALLTTLYRANDRLHRKTSKDANMNEMVEETKSERKSKPCLSSIFSGLRCYYDQRVFPAAMGMALLFMTVLGFDGLAIGYGESVGLPENVLGFFRSFGSAAGVAGAVSYAVFERRFGVMKTGMIGMICQEGCLILAVASIWLPGSPWNPSSYFNNLTWSSWWSSFLSSFSPSSSEVSTIVAPPSSIDWDSFTASNGISLVSIFAFLIGIATARFGLWMADLAITHVMQMAVDESQRNEVFGVHNAICQTFSVMKDLLVIALPSPATFGICILVSFAFVCSGFAAYVYYTAKERATRRTRASSYRQ